MSSTKQIAKPLLVWFAKARRALPWRTDPRDPYTTWISEVMLQQTRVETMLPYDALFLKAFPTLQALAEAPLDEVLAHWSGLGYYARARNLHKAASALRTWPRTSAALQELPGFGPYTAAAVASLAFGEDVPLVDGNVARVFARLYKIGSNAREQSWALAKEHLPSGRGGEYNEALMELGALVCTPRNPRCGDCPLSRACEGKDAPETYPQKKLKPPRPLLEWSAFALFRKDGAVLLTRVAGESLFGGLWELPRSLPTGLTLQGALRDCGVVEQTLTHREVRVTVSTALASGAPEGSALWVLPEGLAKLGLSSLTRKTLRAAHRPQLTSPATSWTFRRP